MMVEIPWKIGSRHADLKRIEIKTQVLVTQVVRRGLSCGITFFSCDMNDWEPKKNEDEKKKMQNENKTYYLWSKRGY
jgi:hypothetical protein